MSTYKCSTCGEQHTVGGTATRAAQSVNVALAYGWLYGFFVGFAALMAFAREWWLWVPSTIVVIGSFVQMGLFIHRHKEVRHGDRSQHLPHKQGGVS